VSTTITMAIRMKAIQVLPGLAKAKAFSKLAEKPCKLTSTPKYSVQIAKAALTGQ